MHAGGKISLLWFVNLSSPPNPQDAMTYHPLERRFLSAFPPEERVRNSCVVAVSGGSDSVALLHLVVRTHPQKGGRVIVAHVNHQLRGQDSDEDAAFCAQLAASLGLKFHLLARPVGRKDLSHSGLEAAARRLRYAALLQVAEEEGARYVLTGHTADDQAETVLFRVFRGAGLRGLAGIPRCRVFGPASLLRPLLPFRRAELRAYLMELGIPFRTDRTNESLDFSRNCLRHVILPTAIQQVHPGAFEGVLKVAATAREAWAFIRECAVNTLERCILNRTPDEVVLTRKQLAATHPLLVHEMLLELWRQQGWPLRKMTRRHLEWLRTKLRDPGRSLRCHAPGGIEVIVDTATAQFRRVPPPSTG